MDLLGYLVQVWSGESLEDYFIRHIFTPLGMKDSYFNLPASKGSRLVNFFQGDSTGMIQKQPTVFSGSLDMNYPLQKTDYFSGAAAVWLPPCMITPSCCKCF